MSVLRLLHGSGHSSKDPYGPAKPGASSSSSKNPEVPSLVLDIPTYGAVFMNTPEDPLFSTVDPSAEKPRNDVVLHGELVITMPPSLGRRRVKSIRVGMRSILKLDLKPGRMNEEDVLFERIVEVAEGESCQCYLNTGTTIFDFTLIIPAGHPPHDWHHNGTLRHFLYAQIDGIPKSNSGPGFLSLRSRSKGPSGSRSPAGHRTPKRGNSPPRSRSSSPAPSPPLDTALLNRTMQLSLENDIKVLAPSYDESITPPGGTSASTVSIADEWLKGTYKTDRTLMLVYNPSPTGEVTVLDLDFTGMAENLGVWRLKLDSNPWTICALLRTHLNFTSIAPEVTIYCVRISLAQTHSISSPRDDPSKEPVVHTKNFLISETGRRPPAETPFPRRDHPAIWRGPEVGGKDTRDLDVEMKGRLPNDDAARPSTVSGVNTPIKVSHTLQVEVYFSIFGQDPRGQAMKHPGPGGCRMLKINRAVVIPSCILVHHHVTLPSYEESSKTAFSNKQINVPCTVCGTRPSDRICTACPVGHGLAPHPRHDHDPKLVGDPSGRCRMCSQGFFPSGTGWGHCACGMSIDQMEERMQRVVEEERGANGTEEMIRSDKEENERGRGRRMNSV